MPIKKRAPAHHSSLNTKQDCLKIVDTFRSLSPVNDEYPVGELPHLSIPRELHRRYLRTLKVRLALQQTLDCLL
jgi:hypothetical protein